MRGPIVVVGAGPAGALLAAYLGRRGCDVTVYESRPDLRTTDVGAGRSINLALATRGIVCLIDIGVIDRVDAITIPMRGRMVHAPGDPAPALQPYGSKQHEVIHSVSRRDLNAILLDAAEQTGRVGFEFEKRIETVDFARSRLGFADGTSAPFGVVFGADGAGSPVRDAIAAAGACQHRTDWLDHGYKELTLAAGPDGGHRLDPNALHLWPRGEFMLIALANPGATSPSPCSPRPRRSGRWPRPPPSRRSSPPSSPTSPPSAPTWPSSSSTTRRARWARCGPSAGASRTGPCWSATPPTPSCPSTARA